MIPFISPHHMCMSYCCIIMVTQIKCPVMSSLHVMCLLMHIYIYIHIHCYGNPNPHHICLHVMSHSSTCYTCTYMVLTTDYRVKFLYYSVQCGDHKMLQHCTWQATAVTQVPSSHQSPPPSLYMCSIWFCMLCKMPLLIWHLTNRKYSACQVVAWTGFLTVSVSWCGQTHYSPLVVTEETDSQSALLCTPDLVFDITRPVYVAFPCSCALNR